MKIIVQHTHIIINDYEMGDCPKLENNFYTWDPINFTKNIYGMYYDKENKRLFLPRGIDIFYLENLFNCKAYIDRTHDEYDKVGDILIKFAPRDDDQKETLAFMLGMNAKYDFTKSHSQLQINLGTGKGKSYCSIATISFLRIRSIILTSSISWLKQWKDYILEYTDILPREIFFIQGSASISSLMKKDMSSYKIILASLDTINSYATTNGWDSITELFKHMRVGIKVFDEAHLRFNTMQMIDFYTDTFKSYYVTATPAKSSEEENRIYQLSFKNVPAISLFDENKDPHSKYVSFVFESKPTIKEMQSCRGKFKLDRNKYTNYVINKDNYFKILILILNIVMKHDGKALFFIGTNDAIYKTVDMLKIRFPELINQIGIFNSLVKNNKEEQLEKKLIFSTIGSLGTAKDIKGLKYVIVLAEPFKSEVLAEQTLGRLRDNNTVYIDCVDKSFQQIMKFYYAKRPVFKLKALSCSTIKFSQNDLDNMSYKVLVEREERLFPIINGLKRIMIKTAK